MCLEVKMTKEGDLPVKIADKDIRCMKVLEQRKDGYITPYRYKHVPDEVISGEEDFTADRNAPGDYELETHFSLYGRAHVEIGGGAVHTRTHTRRIPTRRSGAKCCSCAGNTVRGRPSCSSA